MRETKKYLICQLYGESWLNAISEVIDWLNSNLGTDLFVARDKIAVELLAFNLKITFNENGEIVK